ncbi:MAG: PEP-CTERM sorting domain-containing protein [Phycisphaerae bacterium]|nr:PEP-CTERM sorting domain-containing protein [Phycisphaerae bacterium]
MSLSSTSRTQYPRRRKPAIILAALIGAITLAAGNAQAVIIDFDTLATGEIVTNQFAADGLLIDTDNFTRSFDLGIIYDSTGTDPGADYDLEGPTWAGGNLAPDTVLNNLLIIAQDNTDGNGDGLIDVPNDEGRRPSGEFLLTFTTPITEFGLDLIDIELATENGEVRFYRGGLGGTEVGVIGFEDFVDNTSPWYDPTVGFGDNSANRIASILAETLDVPDFDAVVIYMGGSGGVDNLRYTQVPEPLSLGFLAIGGALITARRRR